ncbi:hypothetical protein UFOVP954_7 [uncultured Caudovirales phage]|jgi:hypothetical protein|uniref:Uncharacterized protein n=1 Tax=uncultured Caudovirales phage TaxID=2100421 RepID=A0A6J5PNY1_9CAUD|nr:hypothetical protein UFOVP954_7 [uncultured Caudovirales phage]
MKKISSKKSGLPMKSSPVKGGKLEPMKGGKSKSMGRAPKKPC